MIIDKTVLTKEGNEHRSLNWVLSHEKITKPDGSQYDIAEDYFGFFPVNRPEYSVKDLSVFEYGDLDSLSRNLDYTDAYGIYENEWVYGQSVNERTPIVYGGMTDKEYTLTEKMYTRRKLVFNEFNDILSPTPLDVRFKMSRLHQIDPTGWTGRYYNSLDTLVSSDIPRWMKRLHRRFLGRPFAYPDIPGIVLIHETDKILVLRSDLDLEHEIPIIETSQKAIDRYGVAEFLRYPYWFEINFSLNPDNTYSNYKLHTTERGDSILGRFDIPKVFPAMVIDDEEHLLHYFCGDFSDNPIPFGLAYFSGVQYIDALFYNNRDFLDRRKFFWQYYLPIVRTTLFDYLDRREELEPGRRLPPAYLNKVSYYEKMGWRYPDVGAIRRGEGYQPDVIYGEQYKSRAYRDSALRAARAARLVSERRSTEQQDTTSRYRVRDYADSLAAAPRDTVTDTVAEGSQQRQGRRDSMRSYYNWERFIVGGRQAMVGVTANKNAERQEEPGPEQAVSQSIPPAEDGSSEKRSLVQVSAKGEFHIIVASLSSRREALKVLENLNDPEAFVVYTPSLNRYRISRGKFSTRAIAQQALANIQQAYPQAWIASY